MGDTISNYLRAHLQDISDEWEREILPRAPELRRLPHGAIIDHMPEFLRGLAHWIDGDAVAARHGFEALAEGHAVTRLGHGMLLETLFEEYRCLRGVLVRRVFANEPMSPSLQQSLLRMHDGLDAATSEAIRRFSAARDALRDRFVGILGHDLRNPLHAVLLAAAQVVGRPCNEPRHARVGLAIQRSSERMMRMIAELIDFASAHLGEGIPALPSPCDMGEICEDAVEELRLANPGREMVIEADGDLRGSWDRDRVLQVISNLVGNALQHGRDPILISATVSTDNELVITRVTNRGTPIPPDLLPRLFDPFRGGDVRAEARREGLGLGLYIVQQIALAHGGQINVRSDDEQTTFEITWPRVPLDVAPHR